MFNQSPAQDVAHEEDAGLAITSVEAHGTTVNAHLKCILNLTQSCPSMIQGVLGSKAHSLLFGQSKHERFRNQFVDEEFMFDQSAQNEVMALISKQRI